MRIPGYHQPNLTPETSLVEDLGEVADDLRQLYTEVGLRPYRVFSVVVQWSGGEVGRGVPAVAAEREFLPTPKVVEWTESMASEARSGGVVELGKGRLEQISPRLTEDQVRQLALPALQPGGESFVEVRHDSRDGVTARRRFMVRGVPYRKADRFEWRVGLQRAHEDRGRDGSLSTATDTPPRVVNPLMGL